MSKEMIDRHAKIAVQLQRKALEALNRLDEKTLKAKDIVELLRLAVEMERISKQ